MTFVAVFNIGNTAAMVGDLLLSTRVSTSYRPPSIHPDYQPSESDYYPSSLVQKIEIINDDLCVGWAGSAIKARHFLNQIKSAPFSSPPLDAEISGFLSSLEPTSLEDIQLIICNFNSESRVQVRGVNVDPYEYGVFSNIFAIGSGAGIVFDIEEAARSLPLKGFTSPDLAAASYMAAAISGQLAFGAGYTEAWGGGFEVLPFRRPFRKLDKVLLRLWTFNR